MTDRKINFPGGTCGCLVVVALTSLICCYVTGWIHIIEDEIKFRIRSRDFPVIEARYKSVIEMMLTVNSDALIDEKHFIRHDTSSSRSEYTGIVIGKVYQFYGTNRSITDILASYVKFFASKPEWTKNVDNSADLYYVNITEYGVTCIGVTLAQTWDYPEEWENFNIVYKVDLTHIEPGTDCRGR